MLNKISKAAFLLIMFSFLTVGFAQDKNVMIAKTADKLQQKLLLSPDQAAKVKDIIAADFDKIKKKDIADVNTKVQALLNDKQKEKFNIIKKDWLNSLSTQK